MDDSVFLVVLTIVALLCSAYILSHTFENFDGGPPTPQLQERNQGRENWALFILLAAGAVVLIVLLPALGQ